MGQALDRAFVCGAILLFGGGLLMTFGWPNGAALFPRLICIAGLAAAVFSAVAPFLSTAAQARESPAAVENRRGEVRAFLWTAGFFVAVWLLGFQFGLPLAIGLYYLVEARLRPTGVAAAVVLTAVLAWLIDAYLQVPLYDGWLMS